MPCAGSINISQEMEMNEVLTISTKRKKIAFFDYPDVFEDFYTHYQVSQEAFATSWHNTGNHPMVKIVQEQVGDVTWYMLSIRPQFFRKVRHTYTGSTIRYFPSSLLHRMLWKLYYHRLGNRWRQRCYRMYATVASYAAMCSLPLLRSLWKEKPDVIFCQEYCSGRFDMLHLIAKVLRIPILTMHAGSTGVYLGSYLKKITLPGTDWVFPSGNREMNFLMQRYHVRAEQMSIIRPPIDFSFFKPMDKREAARALQLPEARRYFLYLGRLEDSMKRVSSIIRAFQAMAGKFSSFDLIIAGNGKDEEELKAIAKHSAGDRIHFTGWAFDQSKAWLLNIADGLVLASRREGFPTVIGEAMACGTPVIAPDVGTIADMVIPGNNGWLYPACDDVKLAESMLEMASGSSPMLRDRMRIREYAIRHISFDAVSRELLRGFNSTLIKQSA